MPDTPTDRLTHTVFYARKVGLPNYSNEEASIFIQVDVARDDTAEQQADAVAQAFVLAKSTVFTQLGIAHDVDTEGVVRERMDAPTAGPDAVTVIRNAIPGAVVEPNVPAAMSAYESNVDPKTLPKSELREWALARFATHPNEFFDNRLTKRNPKAPDLKHKASGVGIWLS